MEFLIGIFIAYILIVIVWNVVIEYPIIQLILWLLCVGLLIWVSQYV